MLRWALLFTLLAAAPAHAQLWTGAPTAGHKTFAFGGFGQFSFAPAAEFMAVAVAEFGIGSRFDIEARFGGGTLPVYAALFLQGHFLATNIIDLAVWGGYHYQDAHHLSVALPISHTFQRVEIYGAPIFVAAFTPTASRFGGGGALGTSIFISRQFRLFVELMLGVSPVLNSGSLGVKFYL